ncbi:palmitoyltransferase ZDHHC23 isoform X1 [Drosophila guanche]|uniref:Palmitoyltransferase n=2 Tax=Drosophila guanche TaxID=7266 RepID=A0A3B0JBY0_DROGU|nr:palmitoyltransferase ZDHHC23 isoform X1 [Drosophila guanche]SPP79555.1 blast:Palmitoyltransferase ZDHHC23 [Drosophila guanche]
MFVMSVAADFIAAARSAESAETQPKRTLCCCEYIAQANNQKSHLLGCCCNCEDLDLVCTRLVTCRRIDRRNIDGMLIAFQDRLRLPWRGGAKRISPAAIAPAFIIPLMLGLATLNSKTAIVLMLTMVGFSIWGLQLAKKTATRTNFFLSWTVFSVFYMILIFECQVPLLELVPEENYFLMFFTCAGIYCLYRTHRLAPLNLVSAQYGTTPKDELPGIAEASSGEEQAEAQTTLQMDSVLDLNDEEVVDIDTAERAGLMHGQPNICESCRKVTPRRAYHCQVCGTCVKRRSHHSYWLNCCIGERNHSWYIAGLFTSLIALILGANLTLTSICHPFLVLRPFGYALLLPDDCSEVFESFELGISFVVACYSLLIANYITFLLARQAFLWWNDTTLHEYKRAANAASNRSRIWSNWRAILK